VSHSALVGDVEAFMATRELTIPAADTRLYAVDAPGGTPALLFLSGGFGTVGNWSRVIRRLDGKYRTVRFDARAGGKSDRSADYSVQAAVDDVERSSTRPASSARSSSAGL
jgi:pimeloyl-ACP methyl ester carboxylesterase